MIPVPSGLRLRLAASGPASLADVLILCVDLAATAEDLVGWWRAHQEALRALPPAELERVVAAKDRRKAELEGE